MSTALSDVTGARVPRAALPLLAALRTHADLRVAQAGDWIWLHWRGLDEAILRTILPIRGSQVFVYRDGQWRLPGQRLPVFPSPAIEGGVSLQHLLVPAPVQAEGPGDRPAGRISLCLVRDGIPRPATAMLVSLASLAAWAEFASSGQLERLEAAHADGMVILRGAVLPPLRDAIRLWGRSVLAPLGFRPEPNLPEHALREVLGVRGNELSLLTDQARSCRNRVLHRCRVLRSAWPGECRRDE